MLQLAFTSVWPAGRKMAKYEFPKNASFFTCFFEVSRARLLMSHPPPTLHLHLPCYQIYVKILMHKWLDILRWHWSSMMFEYMHFNLMAYELRYVLLYYHAYIIYAGRDVLFVTGKAKCPRQWSLSMLRAVSPLKNTMVSPGPAAFRTATY
jgi:hypothetical protein